MGFLDSLSKTLSSGVDRAKYEADKFQRTSRVNGEINNIKSQIDTNVRQLGERALELYQQGTLTAPEIASLAQIIAQLRDQQTQKENELTVAQNETFEAWQATQPQPTPGGPASQNVPISSEAGTNYPPSEGGPASSGYSSPSTIPATSYPPSSGAPLPTYTPSTTSADAAPPASSYTGRSYDVSESTDVSGSGMINSSSVGGTGSQPAEGATPYACPNCGHNVPNNAAFCPNCGGRIAHS